MNSAVIMSFVRFFLLLAAQIIIFNNIDLFGYINPFPYILFIILFLFNNKYFYLTKAKLLLIKQGAWYYFTVFSFTIG